MVDEYHFLLKAFDIFRSYYVDYYSCYFSELYESLFANFSKPSLLDAYKNLRVKQEKRKKTNKQMGIHKTLRCYNSRFTLHCLFLH